MIIFALDAKCEKPEKGGFLEKLNITQESCFKPVIIQLDKFSSMVSVIGKVSIMTAIGKDLVLGCNRIILQHIILFF